MKSSMRNKLLSVVLVMVILFEWPMCAEEAQQKQPQETIEVLCFLIVATLCVGPVYRLCKVYLPANNNYKPFVDTGGSLPPDDVLTTNDIIASVQLVSYQWIMVQMTVTPHTKKEMLQTVTHSVVRVLPFDSTNSTPPQISLGSDRGWTTTHTLGDYVPLDFTGIQYRNGIEVTNPVVYIDAVLQRSEDVSSLDNWQDAATFGVTTNGGYFVDSTHEFLEGPQVFYRVLFPTLRPVVTDTNSLTISRK